MTKVLYPGSFDPITLGHMNIIEQASFIFDEVIIAIMQNNSKNKGFFTLEERYEIINEIYKKINNVNVVLGSGATVDVAKLYECKAIIRGLRGLSDFDNEIQMSQFNYNFSDKTIRTVAFFADSQYQFVSSTMVREGFNLDKDISQYVPPIVNEKMLIKGKK